MMSVTQDPRSSYFLSISSCYSPNCIKELTLQESGSEIIVIGEHCLHSGYVSEGLTLILNSAAWASCLGLAGWDAEPAESPHWRYKQQQQCLGRGGRQPPGGGWERGGTAIEDPVLYKWHQSAEQKCLSLTNRPFECPVRPQEKAFCGTHFTESQKPF